MTDKVKLMPGQKYAIFIDGANLYSSARMLGFEVDYSKLVDYFSEPQAFLLRAYYYTAIDDSEEHIAIKPLIDWLSYNGYTLVTKLAKTFMNNGVKRIKGNMDIEMAVDVMDIAPKVDHIILFTGDGDFRYLIENVQRKGVRVTVVSTYATSTPMVADELRRQADTYIDLSNIKANIASARKRRVVTANEQA